MYPDAPGVTLTVYLRGRLVPGAVHSPFALNPQAYGRVSGGDAVQPV